MITIEHDRDRDMIVIRASGTLTTEEYEHAVPELKHAMELAQGPLRVMIRLEDFRGWEIGALWQELKLDLNFRGDFGRVAVVGETALEEWGTALSAPFAKAEMRFFPTDREAEAKEWLTEAEGGRGGSA
jgi:hypothetical protein